jgi:hypothetical protein
MSLKDEILANPFAERLRNEVKIDVQAFELLCNQLTALAREWSSQPLVDKQLVQELYALPTIIKGAADGLRGHKPDLATQLDDMAITVDGLILEALGR